MLRFFKIACLAAMSLIPIESFCQGEIDEQPKIMLRNEKTGIVFLTSTGIGGGYRFGKRIVARKQTLYDFEITNTKDPKEVRLTSNNYTYSSRSYVYGKENTFFKVKGTFGKQFELYRKNDKGGISIRQFYSIGPVIGLQKPIYYDVFYSIPPGNGTTKTEKFSTSLDPQRIIGKASFFKGFDELTVIPGVTAKAGFSFEYSREDAIIHALEFGIGIDVFPKEIPIMATENNHFYFLNLFAGYRFGKVVDVSDAALASRGKDLRAEKKLSRKLAREQKKQDNNLENY
jgi:hypothetical protein